MIDGFYEGLTQMRAGGEYELYIPADMAYGEAPPPGSPIPPGADLVFEIEVVDIMSQETFDRNMAILQQTMQGAGPAGAGPEGEAPPQPGE
jgi:FKBP-type peptidyl-prolyl cis-trans isomerase FkpA